ncbi:MAG: hypothetical protein U5K28_02005 [Halobacteriales archaeon]|nr:hypothetical protein [Halobacteriales archaeon]
MAPGPRWRRRDCSRPTRADSSYRIPDGRRALLDRAEPSVPERLVDRFTRLVDDLLD